MQETRRESGGRMYKKKCIVLKCEKKQREREMDLKKIIY